MVTESATTTTSPTRVIKTQGKFLKDMEGTILDYRKRVRRLLDKVLQAEEKGEDINKLKFDVTSIVTNDGASII